MDKKATLIITNSYFNVFKVLTDKLNGKTNDLENKNLVFCEEKFSLMAERIICDRLHGSFNTDVYSLGNFLRHKKQVKEVLSKEGSAMAVKNIISKATLNCFSASKSNLAPTLFDLIVQLKSAKVTPKDIYYSAENTTGALKSKLTDIAMVFDEYEKFISERNFDDQSTLLSYLPVEIEKDTDMKDTDVYLVGYSSWTEQARNVISAFINNAKSVTAILVGGDNKFLYLNETVESFKNICKREDIFCETVFLPSELSEESKAILSNIFNPQKLNGKKIKTENVYLCTAENPYGEVKTVAETIKAKVLSGARYRDFTIVIPNADEYKDDVKSLFTSLDIPYFLDEKKKPENHPFIKLIVSYIDAFRSNFKREILYSFYKNPIFSEDEILPQKFYAYVCKNNINYLKIKEPFKFNGGDTEGEQLELFRKKILSCFERFNIRDLIKNLSAEEKINTFTQKLKDLGEVSEAEVNAQVYSKVAKILDDMDMLLSDVKLNYSELKSVFLSGISAMEISVIPQIEDAVFIGGYKETALSCAKYLFALGLTEDVPSVKDDVSLLTDADINKLSEIKVLVEPKIKIVNARVVESVGLALASFSEKLFLFFPQSDKSGKKNLKSEVITYLQNTFTLKDYSYTNGYLTKEQGLKTFAQKCNEFAELRLDDFTIPASYYSVRKDDEILSAVINKANEEVKVRLNNGGERIVAKVSSPTAIEDYYKCPYYAFASRVLNVKEKEDGKVDALSIGNFMHAVFEKYVSNLDFVSDRKSSDKAVEKYVDEVMSTGKYDKYFSDAENSVLFSKIKREIKEYCYKTFLHFKNSKFRPKSSERKITVPLLGGKVNLRGKVDRVDKADKYCRIIDYKTGGYDDTDKSLFAGVKLQLYLYASAILKEEDGVLAGAYYTPISDEYLDKDKKEDVMFHGKTLSDMKAISMQDLNFKNEGKSPFIETTVKDGEIKKALDENAINGYIEYALKMSENAVKGIESGVILPSPYDGACKYCKYSGFCGGENSNERKVKSVSSDVIEKAVKEEKDGI